METKMDSFWLNFKTLFLKQKKNSQICKSWLDPIIPSKMEKKGKELYLTLTIPSDLHKKWLQENLLEDLHRHCHQRYDEIFQIQLEVAKIPHLPFQKLSQTEPPKQKAPYFNPDFVFGNFIVGKHNSLAYGASQSITGSAENTAGFNPLFIYGPSGLGKTHLLNAIGQQQLKIQPESQIVYLSAERFLNEYITALQNKQMEKFRKKFRKNCDLLLMDDIQIIAKGRGIQEEFFHTFNELNSKKAQVDMICCDQAPGSIPHLEDRIKTRMEGGLMVDISYPNKETRIAILKSKMERKGLFLSTEAIQKIIHTCKRSIRELEGVLNKIKIMTELYERDLSLKDIEKILKGLQKELTMEEIEKKVSKHFCLCAKDLKSPSRKKHIVTARQTAMYLIREHLKKSLNDIKLHFNKKDHTTVLNSIKKVENLKLKNKDFKRQLEVLNTEIHNEY